MSDFLLTSPRSPASTAHLEGRLPWIFRGFPDSSRAPRSAPSPPLHTNASTARETTGAARGRSPATRAGARRSRHLPCHGRAAAAPGSCSGPCCGAGTADRCACRAAGPRRGRRVSGTSGHRLHRRPSGPFGLTPRELEVLALLARGAANRPIARQLGIAPKTAGNHIERIYANRGDHAGAGDADRNAAWAAALPTTSATSAPSSTRSPARADAATLSEVRNGPAGLQAEAPPASALQSAAMTGDPDDR